MQSVRLQLEGILRFRDIEYLEITEEGNKVVVVGSPQTKHVIVKNIPLIYNFKNQDREIGKLTVAASLARIYSRLFDRAISLLISQGIKTFLVSSFILIIFHLLVTRHLGSINSYLKSLDLKNLSRPLRLNRRVSTKHDELDQVVDSTNEMAVNLHESYQTINTELELRKQAEEKLSIAYKDIEKRIEERTAELTKATEQLQQAQKMEAIATLAGGVAHNFNNALTPIIGNIDLLEMAHGQYEKTMGRLKNMKTSGLRMAHLTSQLLAYAEGGKYNPQIQSLSGFVEDTLPLIQHTLDPDVRVETDLPLDVKDVEADSTQMQMVLSAIMANSNEAMEGPGRIRISTRNMDLDQEIIKDHPGLKPGPHVSLSIEDDGKGMDDETRNRIFDPFFTTHFMGRGLGMASVYGIVKSHDGAITVDSEPGKGTLVRIYLPAIEAEEKPKKIVASKPEIELPTGDATILVIEDEKDVMMLIQQVLERLGYRVLQAETGKKAIRLARTFDGQIDLALLDIKLPDMTGDKVYPLIIEARPDLKVIVCSGYTIEGPPQDILDAGAEGFIQKPFSIAPFAEKLKEVLER